MELDLDKIEKAARAAALGPWEAYETERGTVGVSGPEQTFGNGFFMRDPVPGSLADAEYIALMSPQTTLALIAEVKRLRAHEKAVEKYLKRTGPLFTEVRELIESIESRLERLS